MAPGKHPDRGASSVHMSFRTALIIIATALVLGTLFMFRRDGNNEPPAGGQGILPYKSGIKGIVLRGPVCPVVRDGDDCDDEPYATTISVARSSSPNETYASMESGKDGRFEFSLPPGGYLVIAANEGISKTCGQTAVAVGPDEVKEMIVRCDTGIR